MASELLDRQLYNGEFHMIHNPDAKGSSPRYKLIDDKGKTIQKPRGVTTILGSTLAKDFVGWALDCMESELLTKLPVITKEDLAEAKQASARKRDSGANTGSETHAMVEHFLKGTADPVAEHSKEAVKAYEAFVTWFRNNRMEVVSVEEVVYSPMYEYAGTYDCLLKVNEKVYLCDLKTTNPSRKAPQGVYPEYFVQLGAYSYAHSEQLDYEMANGGSKLLPIDGLMVISAKKNGKLDIVTNDDIGLLVEECEEMFLRVVNIAEFLRYITSKLGGK